MTDFYIRQDNDLIKISAGAALGSGGEGTVYPITAPKAWSGYCIKVYSDKYRTTAKEHKLSFMIDHPPASLITAAGKLCWPEALAYDTKDTDSGNAARFIGFMMPLAFEGSQELYVLSNLSNKRLSADAAWQKYFNQSAASFDYRLKVCVNLCSVVDLIHQDGNYAVVDFKPQNIMLTADGRVSLVDLDSVQIRADSDGKPHYGRVNTLEYTPPEGAKIIVRETLVPNTWDEFSLAVILYQILLGIHPYMASFDSPYAELNSLSGKIRHNLFVHDQGQAYLRFLPPPHQRFEQLPKDVQQLFKRSFDNRTDDRTSAPLWHLVLLEHLPKSLKHSAVSPSPKPARLVLPFRIGLKALLEWVKQLIVRLNDYQTQQPYSPSTQRLILRQSAKQSPGTNKPRPKPKSKPRTVSPSAANARQAKKPRSTKAQKRRHSSYQKRQYGNHAPPVHQSSTLLSGLLKSKFNSSSNAKPNAQSTTTTKHSNRQRSSPPLVPSPNASQSSPFSGSPSPSIALLHHYRAAFLLAIILLLFTLLATFALVTSPSPQVKQVVSRGDHPSIQIRTTAGSATLANKIKAVTAEDNAIAKSNISDLEAQKLRVTAENKRLTQQNALLETLQDPEASKTLKADAHYKLQKTYLEDIIALRLKLPDDIRDTLPSGQQYPVTVMITLTQFGNVERVKVTESSGTHAVDEYAIKSLMTLEFTPVSLTNAAPTSNYYLDLIYTN